MDDENLVTIIRDMSVALAKRYRAIWRCDVQRADP